MAVVPAQNDGCKILSVVWFNVLPARFGGQKAVVFFNRALAQFASLVCLCSNDNDPAGAGFRVINTLPPGKRQVIDPRSWKKIYLTVRSEKATHLLLEFPYHGIAGLICRRLLPVKLIVNAHNLEHLRFKAMGKWWWRWLYALEKATLKQADAVFFKTQEDLQTAAKTFGLRTEKLSLVPYGAEEKNHTDKAAAQAVLRSRHGIPPGNKLLLFAGTLDYAPNAAAVLALHQKLVPLLGRQPVPFTIVVCGRNRLPSFQRLLAFRNPHMVMAGEVTDVDTYFAAADVFLNPVLEGGGVQTKTMDALCWHLNAVCFASKRAGIEQADNKLFSVADGDWPAFATAVVAAWQKNSRTPAAFFETYNWRTIAAKAFQKIATC